MAMLILEHVKADELPSEWAEQIKARPEETFVVRIEAERAVSSAPPTSDPLEDDDLLFGMWRNHAESKDVDWYVRKLRQSRF